jgi:hypothetical protein
MAGRAARQKQKAALLQPSPSTSSLNSGVGGTGTDPALIGLNRDW